MTGADWQSVTGADWQSMTGADWQSMTGAEESQDVAVTGWDVVPAVHAVRVYR